jgi:Abortive infection alpha
LASAAAGSAIHPSYPSILEQLSPDEARLLDAMYQRLIEHCSNESKALFSLRDLRKVMTISVEQFQIILGNLRRLELCRIDDEIDRFYGPDMNNNYQLAVTGLGKDFIKMCRGPS